VCLPEQVLFLRAVFAHWIAALGVLLTLTPLISDKWRRRIEEKFMKNEFSLKHLWVVGFVFLFVAFYQAWQDEHTSAQQLIEEKRLLAVESNFWKDQSYQKDASLRTMSELLAKNFTTLSNTQQSFAQISGRLLDLAKPEPQKTTYWLIGSISQYADKNRAAHSVDYIVLTNKPVSPIKMLVTCSGKNSGNRWDMPNAGGGMGSAWGAPISPNSYRIGISAPPWTPTGPMIVTVYSNQDDVSMPCKFEEQP
jgi:hypothetical protein